MHFSCQFGSFHKPLILRKYRNCNSRLSSSFDLVALELAPQRDAVDAEDLSGQGLVAAGFGEHPADVIPLLLLQRRQPPFTMSGMSRLVAATKRTSAFTGRVVPRGSRLLTLCMGVVGLWRGAPKLRGAAWSWRRRCLRQARLSFRRSFPGSASASPVRRCA